MNDLVQWLVEQLDEDERTARAADGDEIEASEELRGAKYLTLRGDHNDRHTNELPAALADHCARHDPARVLRDIDAKRQILDEHPSINVSDLGSDCGTCYREDGVNAHWPCRTLRLLALPYADRPDYRDEWRP